MIGKGFIILLCLSLTGCATPVAYKIIEKEDSIILTTEPSKLFGIWEIKGVPAGEYAGKIGDKEIKVNTKVDLRMIDVNMSKIGGT